MSGWNLQVMATLPTFLGALNVAVFPGWIVLVVKLPSAAARVCMTGSSLRTLTVAPGLTISIPPNAKSLIVMTGRAAASGVAVALAIPAPATRPVPNSTATTQARRRDGDKADRPKMSALITRQHGRRFDEVQCLCSSIPDLGTRPRRPVRASTPTRGFIAITASGGGEAPPRDF